MLGCWSTQDAFVESVEQASPLVSPNENCVLNRLESHGKYDLKISIYFFLDVSIKLNI